MDDIVVMDLIGLKGWVEDVLVEAKRIVESDELHPEATATIVKVLEELVKRANAYLVQFSY